MMNLSGRIPINMEVKYKKYKKYKWWQKSKKVEHIFVYKTQKVKRRVNKNK